MEFTPGFKSSPRLEEENEQEDSFQTIKKQLFSDVEPEAEAVTHGTSLDQPDPVQANQKQSVLIYLRVRPKRQEEIMQHDPDCLHVTSDQELIAIAPRNSKTHKNNRSINECSQRFTFSRIFEPATTQKALFDEALRPLLKDFFEGQNCLVFTYGVTNSGKSYTVTGTPSEPGLLPRALDVVFSSLDLQQQLSEVKVRPERFSELRYLKESEQEELQQWKEHILNLAKAIGSRAVPPAAESSEAAPDESIDTTTTTGDQDISTISSISRASSDTSKITDIDGISFDEFQLQGETSLDLRGMEDQQFAIFVSFAEIYNEYIYDLLIEAPGKGKYSRPALRVSQDRHQNYYIKGLREVQVQNAEEAMLILRLGLKHRHVASTRLNYQSSRSHSIYTIKLVRMAKADKPHNALINRISIVDLAGAERSGKTGASGMRVKEAGNINNSLLALGKCIEAMKYNQSKRCTEERLVPFRDSKLTQLFQNYFVGKGEGIRRGKITMFVNVSNNASVFDETFHVLKFSALTSKVMPITKAIQVSSAYAPPTPHIQAPTTSAQAQSSVQEWVLTAAEVDRTSCPNCQALEEELSSLKEANKNVTKKELIEREYVIRQEVSKEFRAQLTKIEEEYDREIAEQAEEYEEMFEKRMESYRMSVKKENRRKRMRHEEDDDEEEEMFASDRTLRVKIANLQERVKELETELSLSRVSAEERIAAMVDELDTCHTDSEEKGCRVNLAELKLQEVLVERDRLVSECTGLNSQVATLKKDLHVLEQEKCVLSSRQSAAAPVTSWELQESSLQSDISSLREEISVLTSHVARLEEELEQAKCDGEERSVLVARLEEKLEQAKCDGEERSVLVARLEEELEKTKCDGEERSVLVARLEEELEKAKCDGEAELEILQARISELIQEASTRECVTKQADSISASELISLRQQLKELEECRGQISEQLEAREKENALLKKEMQKMANSNDTLQEMKESVTNTLMEYKTTLTSQDKTISELKEDSQTLQDLNHALEEKVSELEVKLRSANSSKQCLSFKVTQLSEQLEESRETGSRRVAELTQSSDQCRAMLTSTSDDLKEAQLLLRKKEDEVASLETTVAKLTSNVEEAKATVESLKGQHQLECAQLSIRVRELTQQLQRSCDERDEMVAAHEVEIQRLHSVEMTAQSSRAELEALMKKQSKEIVTLNKECKQHQKNLKALEVELEDKNSIIRTTKQNSELFQEKIVSLESELAASRERKQSDELHVYEQPPEESTDTIYDTIPEIFADKSSDGSVRRSYLQAVENLKTVNGDLDRSKPFVANLESSDQLVEDSFLSCDGQRVEIDATPLPVRKKGKRGNKRKIEQVENKEPVPTPTPHTVGRYTLRGRKAQSPKPEFEDDEDYTPSSTKRFKKLRNWATGKKPPKNAQVQDSCVASRTRRKIQTKDISGPLILSETPEGKNAPSRIKLGQRVYPGLYRDSQEISFQ